MNNSVFNLNGARGTIANSSISNIDMTGTSATWSGVNVTGGGSADVTNTTFANDKQMLSALLAFGKGSTVNADQITLTNVAGSGTVVSFCFV